MSKPLPSHNTVTAEDILSKLTTEKEPELKNETQSQDCVKILKQSLQQIPRGQPKSGRKWKTKREQRFSSMTLDKPLKTSWQKKMKIRAELKSVKKYEKELKEAKAKELEEKRKRQAEHKKRKEENQRKAEVVQVIKDTRKIKKMKKSQLRNIAKR